MHLFELGYDAVLCCSLLLTSCACAGDDEAGIVQDWRRFSVGHVGSRAAPGADGVHSCTLLMDESFHLGLLLCSI